MAAGTLGGFYGGSLVGAILGAIDRSRQPWIKMHGGRITGTIGAAIGAVISAFIIGGAIGAVAAGARWGLLSGMAGSIIGGIVGQLIGQRGFTLGVQRHSLALRIGYWATTGGIGAAVGGPVGRILDTPDLLLSRGLLLEAVGWGGLGGAVGSIVVGVFLVFAYDL
jgi:hypothetical protein